MAEVSHAIDEFVLKIGLGAEAGDFLRSLPADICGKVLESFDPSGTKDGNLFGRLQGFARSLQQFAAARGGGNQMPTAPTAHGSTQGRPTLEYAHGIGLNEVGTNFLLSLPMDVQGVIVAEFNPSGTKDGNVLARLSGFARSVWAQRLGLDTHGMQEATGLLRGLPEDVQARVMGQFDPSRSKDGNVLARLHRFAQDVAAKGSGKGTPMAQATTMAPSWRPTTAMKIQAPPLALHSQATASRRPPVVTTPAPINRHMAPATVAGTKMSAVLDFCSRLHLDAMGTWFIQSLPDEVQGPVLASFDMKGTKDGNVWARLFGFARSIWLQRLGLDADTAAFLKGLPEDVQCTVMVKFDPAGTHDGNVAARLQSFARSVAGGTNSHPVAVLPHPVAALPHPVAVLPGPGPAKHRQSASYEPNIVPFHGTGGSAGGAPLDSFAQHWNLNPEAKAFLAALPDTVRSSVTSGFNASGTKDGNIWARLFGFVRSVWGQHLHIDAAAMTHLRSMSEEAQIAVMMQFDPALADEASAARFQTIADQVLGTGSNIVGIGSLGTTNSISAESALLQDGNTSPTNHDAMDDPSDLQAFAARCNLDETAVAFMESLAPEVCAAVIADFDPSGTKDGNVFGRLQGFARSVEKRRLRHAGDVWQVPQSNGSNVVAHAAGDDYQAVQAFALRCNLDQTAASFVQSLDPQVRGAVIADFDPSGTKDGNVFGRLQGFARSVENRQKRFQDGGSNSWFSRSVRQRS